MNLATAPDRAHRATRSGGVRLHHNVSYELAYGTHHDRQHRERGERALTILEDRFPGIAEEAADITDPPQLSRQAQTELEREQGDREDGGGDRRAGRQARQQGGRRRGAVRSTRQAAGRSLSLADSASGGWGTTIGDAFVWAAGLSIFYLLITKAAAAGKFALGVTNIARAIVSPHVDPLNPKGIS